MSLFHYIQQGGPVMYLLLVLNIIGLTLLLWKTYVVVQANKSKEVLKGQLKESLQQGNLSSDNSANISLLKDLVHGAVHHLESGLNTIKVIATISPLLGLLGTVLGILSAFQVISSKGLSDPSLFAGGIAMALITTVGGLIVAIPHFVGHNYLVSALDDLEVTLEKELIQELYSTKANS